MGIKDSIIYNGDIGNPIDYIFVENAYVNVILRDKVIDDGKNPFLGDLFKVLRVERESTINYPSIDNIVLEDIILNNTNYYIFSGWKTSENNLPQTIALNNQELFAVREKYSIPNYVNIQLVGDLYSLIDEFKVYSTKDFHVQNQISCNGIQINIIKNSIYHASINQYETNFEFIINMTNSIEGNCICLDNLKLQLFDIDTGQMILEHEFNMNIFTSDSSTGD